MSTQQTIITINSVNFDFTEILTFRFSEGNTKFTFFIKATEGRRLINISNTIPSNGVVEFSLVQEGVPILEFESPTFDFTFDYNGELFAERLEITSATPIF